MRRITVEVKGCFIYKSASVAGVQGEGNTSTLRILFDEGWQGYGKRVIWRDARGINPVSVILGADQMTGEDTPLDYTLPIPPEPLAFAGWCSLTIEGYTQLENGTKAVALTASDHLEVLHGGYGQPAEPTPSQALQLQQEIDGLLGAVTAERQAAADHAALAEDAALRAERAADTVAGAEAAAEQAMDSADSAAGSARLAESWAVGGTDVRVGEDQNNAMYWAQQASHAAGGGVSSFNGRAGFIQPQAGDYTKADVGLGNVDNSSDLDKPISTAVQSELNKKAPNNHSHSANYIAAGTFGGKMVAKKTEVASVTVKQVRNIYAGTEDMTAGVTALNSGDIYLVYEVQA